MRRRVTFSRNHTLSLSRTCRCVNPDLVAHQGSPTKHPELRLEAIRPAAERTTLYAIRREYPLAEQAAA